MMARLICQTFIVLVCLPLGLRGQPVRIVEVEKTGPEYSRLHFSYFDSLLSEIRTYDRGEKWVRRVIFTFNEDYKQYVGADVLEGNQRTHWSILYANGRVAEIVTGGLEKQQTYLFQYNKAGLLKSIKLSGKVKGRWKYTFNGDNLSSLSYKMPRKFPMAGSQKTYTSYDDHPNYWSLATKTMWKHRAILAIFFDNDCWSRNNPTRATLARKKEIQSFQYEYAYDSLGNPVQIRITAPGQEDVFIKLSYSGR